MGVFSKYHRFREAGEQANVVNVEQYGQPVRSLFTSTKILSLKHEITITDENEVPVYTSKSKIISIHDKTDVYDASGNPVSHIEKKVISLHERHFVTMEDGTQFQLSNEIWHIVKDITNIEGLGWQLRGNIIGLNFELFDENGEIIALIKMLSLHDKYCIDIYQPDKEAIVVSILITLQHMIRDRETAAASSSSASSSN